MKVSEFLDSKKKSIYNSEIDTLDFLKKECDI